MVKERVIQISKIEGNICTVTDKEGNVYKYINLSKHKFHKVKSYLQGYDQLTSPALFSHLFFTQGCNASRASATNLKLLPRQ